MSEEKVPYGHINHADTPHSFQGLIQRQEEVRLATEAAYKGKDLPIIKGHTFGETLSLATRFKDPKLWLCFYRRVWQSESGYINKYVYVQVPSSVPQHIIPGMTSMPEAVKHHLLDRKVEYVHYCNQMAVVILDKDGSDNGRFADIMNYTPTVEDIQATDWWLMTPAPEKTNTVVTVE